MKRYAVFGAAIAMILAIGVTREANAESCIDYLENQYLSAKSKARSCGVSADHMGAVDQDYSSPSLPDCSAGLQDVGSQLEAFEECAGVYYCASRAYKCAMERASAGADCNSAMSDCISEYPVQ